MRVSQKVREHLQFLELNGRLTPDRVVADAKRDDSPLHSYFTWDVTKAAEAHWRNQARELIRTVKVMVICDDITIKAPYYVLDPSKEHREQGYTSVESIRQNTDLAKQSLLLECERAASMLRRARLIAVALGLEEQIDTMLTHVAGLREQLREGDKTATQ